MSGTNVRKRLTIAVASLAVSCLAVALIDGAGNGAVAASGGARAGGPEQPLSAEDPFATAPPEEYELPPGAAIDAGRTIPEASVVAARGGQPAITLRFGGDVHFENQVRRQQHGLSSLAGLFGSADISMINLETALATSGTPQPKGYRFHASPGVLNTLRQRGIDVVTMANNHALDFGRVGLAQTLRARSRSKLPVVGIGGNVRDAVAPWTTRIAGTSFAFLGAMDNEPLGGEQNGSSLLRNWTAGARKPGIAITPGARPQLLASVRKAALENDVVVVYVHWGIERTACPSRGQVALMQQLRKAGADVIIGAHPHVLQGAGFVGSTAVAYSLGNFVWYNTYSRYSIVLQVDIVDGKPAKMSYVPVAIGADGLPRPTSGDGAQWVRARLASGAKCARLNASPPSGAAASGS